LLSHAAVGNQPKEAPYSLPIRKKQPRLTGALGFTLKDAAFGASRATGRVAVIDVFRAFTTAAVALANGASQIVMVRTVRKLWTFGVRVLVRSAWAKFGNSPFEVSTVEFRGKTIIQRTSAGTQGIVEAATKAERLYAVSLVTSEATVRALLSGSPDQISLVAMGDNGIKGTDEDELCAIHIRNRLEGRPGDPDAIRRLILAGGEVGRFRDPSRPYLHPEDVEFASISTGRRCGQVPRFSPQKDRDVPRSAG
jgi:2-phosphosulfolactate phosphatase